MKVTGWTDYDHDLPEVPDELQREAQEAIIQEIRTKGYRFSGYEHQNDKHGTPIIDGKYKFICSSRTWGGIMADALECKDWRDYLLWTWYVVEGEVILPENGQDDKE